MQTQVLWQDTADKPPVFPVLEENLEADVLIIGAGITGLIAAYNLMTQGFNVLVVERDTVGNGTTGNSSGNLYVPVQPYFQNVIKKFNVDIAKDVAQARKFAIDFIQNLILKLKIDCKFSRRPWFLYASNEKEIDFLDKEMESFKKCDVNVHSVPELPLPLKFKKCIQLDKQARFNPYQFCIKLAEYLQENGCKIFQNTEVSEIQEKHKCTVITPKAKISAQNVIIATHTPLGINSVQIFTAPYRSYVVAATLKEDYYPEGHFWDLSQPHHAICTQPWKTDAPGLVLIAGNHHKTGQDKDAIANYAALTQHLQQQLNIQEIAYRWSAQHYHSADDLPYIGLAHRNSKLTYMATGYFADGLVYGALAGVMLCEAILNKENTWNKTFNSRRFTPLASAAFLAKENVNVLTQYLKDMPFCNSHDFSTVKNNEGKVLEINSEKCGVYRDDNGNLHIVSAVCTHMKCIVNWNNAEKTWDCPCHGSRFTTHGEVIEGPAISALEKKPIGKYQK